MSLSLAMRDLATDLIELRSVSSGCGDYEAPVAAACQASALTATARPSQLTASHAVACGGARRTSSALATNISVDRPARILRSSCL